LFLTTNPPEFVELYPNRQQPDAAFLSRIGAQYWVDYLKPSVEREAMIEAAPLLSSETLDRMQRVIDISRQYLARQDINFAFSTRHAVNWAKKAVRHNDLKRAAFEAFLAAMDSESKSVMLSKILDSQLD
jgi:MoxR-like ATPase